MDEIKKAFQKVKEDISLLTDSIREMRDHLLFLHNEINKIHSDISTLENNPPDVILIDPTDRQTVPADRHINQTQDSSRQTVPADNSSFKDLIDQDLTSSIGNDGVPADRQTNRQTNRQTHSTLENPNSASVEEVANILDSLDSIKKNLRRQFKQLTEQEFLVFSTIYQLEDSKEHNIIDYSILATTLNLTESSIRDYVVRLLKKGIPIEKTKINNKKVNLSISSNLKKIANLSTIMALRDI